MRQLNSEIGIFNYYKFNKLIYKRKIDVHNLKYKQNKVIQNEKIRIYYIQMKIIF